MEYIIVSNSDKKELVDEVNEMMNHGWETEGGVSISPDGIFHQAMLKFDDDDEFDTGEEL